MPKLGLLQCDIKWYGCDRPLAEHGIQYHDSHVEAWLAVPLNPTPFYCHITSNGWIATGLSAFVYIDGEYMCNRAKPNLQPPGPNENPASSCIDFKLRQKEVTMVDGGHWGMPWMFSQVNAVPPGTSAAGNVPWGGQHVGTIEVVVLRHAPDDTELPRGLMTAAKRSHWEAQASSSAYKGPPRFGVDGVNDSDADDRAGPAKRAHIMSMDGASGTGPGFGGDDTNWNFSKGDKTDAKEEETSWNWDDGDKRKEKARDTSKEFGSWGGGPAVSLRGSKSIRGGSRRGSQVGSRRGSVPVQNITINVAAGGSALIGPAPIDNLPNGSPDRGSHHTKGTSPPTSETGWGGRKAGLTDRSPSSNRSKMPGSWVEDDEKNENNPPGNDDAWTNDTTGDWATANDTTHQNNNLGNWGGIADDTNEDQNQDTSWGDNPIDMNQDQNQNERGSNADIQNQDYSWGDDNDNSGNNNNAPGGDWNAGSDKENQNTSRHNDNGGGDWGDQSHANRSNSGQACGGNDSGGGNNAHTASNNEPDQISGVDNRNGGGNQGFHAENQNFAAPAPQQPAQNTSWGDGNNCTTGTRASRPEPTYIKIIPQASYIPAMQSRPGAFPSAADYPPRSYWGAWKHAEDKNGDFSRPIFDPSAGYQPVYSLPIELIQKNHTTHQVQLGEASMLPKHKYSPKYLDTLETPFAVFTFHYRDQATLSATMGKTIIESREEEAERLCQLSSAELLQIMYGRLDYLRAHAGPAPHTAPLPAPHPAQSYPTPAPDPAAASPRYTMGGAQPVPAPGPPQGFSSGIAGSMDAQKLSDKLSNVNVSQQGGGPAWGGGGSDENVKPADNGPGGTAPGEALESVQW